MKRFEIPQWTRYQWPYNFNSYSKEITKDVYNNWVQTADKIVDEWDISHNCFGQGWESAVLIMKEGRYYELHDFAFWNSDIKDYDKGWTLLDLGLASGQLGDGI